MIKMQEKHMESIYSSYNIPIEEEDDKYTFSIQRPLHQILENVIIKEHGSLSRAIDKLKSVRYLLRLQWRVNNDRITGDVNYKMFLDLLSDTKMKRLNQENFNYIIRKL
jgi:hypothetical protein